jgi:hypothetical protein
MLLKGLDKLRAEVIQLLVYNQLVRYIMRKLGISHLQNHLSKELKDLPFIITNYGQTVAVVIDPPKEGLRVVVEEAEKGTGMPQKGGK